MTGLDRGDTGFVLLCSALVLFMTPGLAFFYGGLVRSRNVVNTMMMSFVALTVVGVEWVIAGYSLAFSDGEGWAGAVVGGFSFLGLSGVGGATNARYAGTIPHVLYSGRTRRCLP